MRHFFEKKLQWALNRFLMLDPESKNRILALNGKIMTIRFLGTAICLQFYFDNYEIKINTSEALPSDTLIIGTPLTLAHLTLSKDKKKFFEEDVTLSGDVELGQNVLALFAELQIDWEEYLSHFIGDVSAHSVGRVVSRFLSFKNHVKKSIQENINEYIHEEAMWVPQRAALEHFFEEVDALRMDTDRLEKLIEELENKVLTGAL